MRSSLQKLSISICAIYMLCLKNCKMCERSIHWYIYVNDPKDFQDSASPPQTPAINGRVPGTHSSIPISARDGCLEAISFGVFPVSLLKETIETDQG